MRLDKTQKIVAIVRDIAIIFSILAFMYWWFFVPDEYNGDYYYELEDIPEENTSVDV